jgi:FkbM family methyltransferase
MNIKLFVGLTIAYAERKLMRTFQKRIKKYYPHGRNWLYDLCRSGIEIKTIFDIGANNGSVSKECALYFPDSKIHSFEPISDTFSKLNINVSQQKNIFTHKLALADYDGEAIVFLAASDTINSLKRNVDYDQTQMSESIVVTKLDTFCKKNQIVSIDLLKIDVEGFEKQVIDGGLDVLRSAKAIFVEVGLSQGDYFHTDIHSMVFCLRTIGFEIAGFYEQGRNRERKIQVYYTNILFLRKEYLN